MREYREKMVSQPRTRSLAMVAKMRRIQQNRKGKQKVLWSEDEGDGSDQDDSDEEDSLGRDGRETSGNGNSEEDCRMQIEQTTATTSAAGACDRLLRCDQNPATSSSHGKMDGNLGTIDEDDKSVALVTFVEKSERDGEERGGCDGDRSSSGGLCPTNVCQPLNKVQFYAEDGRVDVGEILDHLDATNLEYEWKPGIWKNLRSLKSGKSTKKFKNLQTVFVRKTSLKDFWPWKSQHRSRPWVDTWLVEGDTRKDYCSRVSRLCFDGRAGVVGTAVKFENPYGLLLTAHHCCTWIDPASGKTLVRDNLSAFNTRVDIVHLSSNYDLAFLLMRSGPYVGGFRLASKAEEQRGRPVRMISFPWHVDNAYGFDHGSVAPTEVHGHIANLGPKEQKLPLFVDALATYMGGFAASPGGAVTLNSKVLVGVHVRAIWHQKGETILPFKGKTKLSTNFQRGGMWQRQDFGESSTRHYRKARIKRKRNKASRRTPNVYGVVPKKMKLKEMVPDSHHQDQDQDQDQDGDPRCSTSTCSCAAASNAMQRKERNALVNCVLVNRNSDAKCSMYHGYLSTYLSARHLTEEYNNFVASCTAMEETIGKNCLSTGSSRDRSQSRNLDSSRSRHQTRSDRTNRRRSTLKQRRRTFVKRRRKTQTRRRSSRRGKL